MTVAGRIATGLARTLDVLETVLIGGLSLAALGLGVMQVVLRYVFNTGFEWTEAAFILCTVTAMLAAGSRAVAENRHVRVDILSVMAPRRIGRIMDLAAHLVSLALCLFYIYCGVLFVQFAKMMDTASPDTGLMDWVVYSIMPVALGLFCLRYLLAIRTVALERPEEQA